MSREPGHEKSLDLTVTAIERQFGKGSIMRLGEEANLLGQIPVISTGSLGLDIALGGGGLPREGVDHDNLVVGLHPFHPRAHGARRG